MVFIVDDLHLRRSCFGIIYSVDLCWAMRVHIWLSEPLFFLCLPFRAIFFSLAFRAIFFSLAFRAVIFLQFGVQSHFLQFGVQSHFF